MKRNGATTPIWDDGRLKESVASLDGATTADVCVVGAGIAGLSVAYSLCLEGMSVVVLDARYPGSGETARTTAHLSNALDDRYAHLEKVHGRDGARLAAGSHTQAIDHIERVADVERIACAFERLDGYLFLKDGDHSTDVLEGELAASHRAGLSDVELTSSPLGGAKSSPCLRFPRQAQFDPLAYLAGLVRAVRSMGGRIFSGAEATEFDDKHVRVKTRRGETITSNAIVVATNTPINDRVTIHTKQAAYRTYAIALRMPANAFGSLMWDTGDPYHYVRAAHRSGGDLLIVGGEDHKTGQSDDDPEEYFARLVEWARIHFPFAEDVAFQWSGQVLEPNDGLAFIGRNPGDNNIFIVTGDSGHGMTHGTLAGLILPDLIAQRPNPWASLYNPGRVRLGAITEFTAENTNVAAQYLDLVKPGEVESESEIPLGSGAIVRDGLNRIAVYKDDNGVVHRHAAICPHLGCSVTWNSVEKTWDCPCHGSRFSGDGSLLNGPATSALRSA
jgi:glycine/D-amino acid oxidase-like deaminating enzyme/nitrite reductase/ring-hydroxylating ferredoxin subunit